MNSENLFDNQVSTTTLDSVSDYYSSEMTTFSSIDTNNLEMDSLRSSNPLTTQMPDFWSHSSSPWPLEASSPIVTTSERNHTVSLPPAHELSFWFEFFLPGLLLNSVGCLGLVGNGLSIFILSRPQMKGSTNCILIGLATYDIILILSR